MWFKGRSVWLLTTSGLAIRIRNGEDLRQTTGDTGLPVLLVAAGRLLENLLEGLVSPIPLGSKYHTSSLPTISGSSTNLYSDAIVKGKNTVTAFYSSLQCTVPETRRCRPR